MKTADQSHEQQTDQTDRHLLASRYRLLTRIGRGRLGEIYEAADDQHRDFAVKRYSRPVLIY